MTTISLIIGAGASKELDFPVGEELKTKWIIGCIGEIPTYDQYLRSDRPQDLINQYFAFLEEETKTTIDQKHYYNGVIKPFQHELRNFNGSVDAFLQNRDHGDNSSRYNHFGRFAIAYFIIGQESGCMRQTLFGLKENWLKLFLEEQFVNRNLIQSLRDAEVKLSIITFNYDRTIEHYLYNFLRFRSNPILGGIESAKFIEDLGIHHVYGKIADLDWETSDANSIIPFGGRNDNKTFLSTASKAIRLIGQRVDDSKRNLIRNLIRKSDRVYLLGFGYDRDNMKVLFGDDVENKSFKINSKCIGTSYGISSETMANYPFIEYHNVKCAPMIKNNQLFKIE